MAERILIIGSPGSGKSTMSRALSERTGLPRYHLDQMHWQPGWVEAPKAEFLATLERVLAEPRWVIDGNYTGSLDLRLTRADQVILLDIGPLRCLWRAVRRSIMSWGKTRPDMAEGCPERLSLEFWWYILSFRVLVLPRVLKKLEGFAGEVVWLGNGREVRAFLSGERLGEDGHR